MWETSHYCRLADEAGLYIPSSPFGDTVAEAEHKMLQYIKRFERQAEVSQNDYYK